MPRHATVATSDNAWTELTSADVTNITFQAGQNGCMVKRSTGTAPTDEEGAINYQQGEGETNVALASLQPGGSGSRVWAKSLSGGCPVTVSHA